MRRTHGNDEEILWTERDERQVGCSESSSVQRFGQLMQVDKKAAAGRIRFVVLRGIGAAEVRCDIDDEVVRETIAACNVRSAVVASQ